MDTNYWDNNHHILHHINILGIDHLLAFIHSLAFILTANTVGVFILTPWRLLTQLIAVEFLGKPLRGDDILGQMGKDFTGQPANILEDLLGGFGAAADDMFAHIDKWLSESVRQSVLGTAGSAITTSTRTSTLRVNRMCDLSTMLHHRLPT